MSMLPNETGGSSSENVGVTFIVEKSSSLSVINGVSRTASSHTESLSDFLSEQEKAPIVIARVVKIQSNFFIVIPSFENIKISFTI